MPVGVKQHLVGLQQVGAQQKGPAVRQLDVGHLKLGTLSTQNGEVVAPVELEGLARTEGQGDKGPPSCRLLLTLTVRAPVPRKGGHAVVGSGEAELDQIGVHLLQRSSLLARLADLRLQPAGQLPREGVKLAWTFRRRKLWLDRVRRQML